MAHSAEEEVARDYLCFGAPDGVVVVCDATCLERNLNLVLQTMEITGKVVVCVNLMDEARRKGVHLNLESLSKQLGVPVIPTAARSGKGLDELLEAVETVLEGSYEGTPLKIRYLRSIEEAAALLEPVVREVCGERLSPRWLALRLLDADPSLLSSLETYLGFDPTRDERISKTLAQARKHLLDDGISQSELRDKIVSCIVLTAEGICADTVTRQPTRQDLRDRRLDRVLTNKWTGFPIMIALMAVIFWLTITGSNYPSELLSTGLFWIQDRLTELFWAMGAPPWLEGLLVQGVYRVLAWIMKTDRYPAREDKELVRQTAKKLLNCPDRFQYA